MKKECVGCHGLRIITIQRLARPAWEKELDKMAGWGAKTSDRKMLVDYLVSEYGNDRRSRSTARSSIVAQALPPAASRLISTPPRDVLQPFQPRIRIAELLQFDPKPVHQR
jgi:hypothetical protein